MGAINNTFQDDLIQYGFKDPTKRGLICNEYKKENEGSVIS